MHPAFKLLFDGVDITAIATDRLISLALEDNAGLVNDRFTLILDDRELEGGQPLPIPPQGATVTVELGYEQARGVVNPFNGLKKMGTFAMDEVELTKGGGGRSMTLTGHATDTNFSFVKKPHSDKGEWRNVTLAKVVGDIAARNNFEARIHPDYDGEVYRRVYNQTSRADADFLFELSKDNNAFMKVQDGKLYFAPTEKMSEVAEQDIVPADVDLLESDTMDYRFIWQGRSNFTGVRAKFRDKDLKADEYITSYVTPHPDAAECWYEIKEEFPNRKEAQSAVDSRKRQLDYSRAKLSITAIGNPLLMAGAILHLKTFRSGIPLDWRIISATHSLDAGGYITNIDAEVKDAKVLDTLPQRDTVTGTTLEQEGQ